MEASRSWLWRLRMIPRKHKRRVSGLLAQGSWAKKVRVIYGCSSWF